MDKNNLADQMYATLTLISGKQKKNDKETTNPLPPPPKKKKKFAKTVLNYMNLTV